MNKQGSSLIRRRTHFSLKCKGLSAVSITLEVDAWANQCKQWSLVFYKGESENQGRVASGEGQISDKQTDGRLLMKPLQLF